MFSRFEDGRAAQEWHTYLLQRADQARLAQRIARQHRQPYRWPGVLLVWLGERLSAWGQTLQRHDVFSEVTDSSRT